MTEQTKAIEIADSLCPDEHCHPFPHVCNPDQSSEGLVDGLKADSYRLKLLDLLAVIHRDGGHKTEEIGIELAWQQAMQLSSERIAELASLRGERDRLAGALSKAEARFNHCANMIAESHAISGTLRAERTIKARHYALEARAALQHKDMTDDK